MKVICLIMYIFVNTPCIHSQEQTTTIKIGLLFDQKAPDYVSISRGVDYAVMITNNSDSIIKIDPIINLTDNNNNYAFSDSLCYQTEQMVFTLFGVASARTFDLIESYAQTLQMPFILPSCYRTADVKKQKFIICMNPSYITPIADYVAYFHWNRVFFLFDADDGLWRLEQLYEELENLNVTVSLVARRIPNPSFAYDILRSIDKIGGCEEKLIILDLSHRNNTVLLLRQIIDVGMNRYGYHYIIGGLDILSYNLSIFRHGGSTISGFHLVNTESEFFKKFYKKWIVEMYGVHAPELTVQAALAVDGIALLTTALNRMWRNTSLIEKHFATRRGVFCNTNTTCGIDCRSNPLEPFYNGPLIQDALTKIQFEGLSGNIKLDENGRRTGYNLSLYQMGKTKPLERRTLTKVGEWTTANKLTIIYDRPNKTERQEPNRTRIVTTILESPFVQYRTTNTSNGESPYEGYAVDLLKLIFRKLKDLDFDFVLRPRNDKEYGVRGDNNSWTGLMGEVISGQADMAVGPVTITEERQHEVDFTKPFMKLGISLMIKRPDIQKPGVFSFKEPLSNSVWLCIIFGFLAVSLILFLVGRFSPYEWSENSGDGPSEDFNFLNALWSSLGALMQQGSDIFPRSISGRIAESAWWFFTLIIVSSYTANLAAFLTIENLQVPINSVDDLIKQDKIKYGCKSGGSTYSFFKESKVYTYEKMFKQMTEWNDTVFKESNEKGWQKVITSKGEYAFLIESSLNEYFNQRLPCKTMKVGGNINNIGYGIVTRKGSNMSKWINLAVLELRESGELFKLEQKWWYDKGQCGSLSSDGRKRELSLSNVSGIFHILIGGLVLAMLIGICEYMLHIKRKQRKKTITKSKDKKVEIILPEDKGERQPLRTLNANGAQENRGKLNICSAFLNSDSTNFQYQTSASGNLIVYESIAGNGQTQL